MQLSEAEIKLFKELCRVPELVENGGAHKIQMNAGSVLVEKGEIIEDVFILLQGSVLSGILREGNKYLTSAFFRAPSLMRMPISKESQLAPFDVTAIEPSLCFSMNSTRFMALADRALKIRRALDKATANDILNLSSLADLRIHKKPKARVAGGLSYIADEQLVTAPLNHFDIASITGVNRITVCEDINAMIRAGILISKTAKLKYGRNQYQISSLADLLAIQNNSY